MSNNFLIFSEINGCIGQITLNRPEALNALNLEMTQRMDQQLAEWAQAAHIKAVVIRSNNNRAFCAGGDIRELYKQGQQSIDNAIAFFRHEYRLNDRIYHYPKPYIAFMDGITMGGGVGISIHGSYRIGTENLIFAMPETGIGFFPDVGASYFLSQCPGYTGIYLGLTGARLTAADALSLGLIDTFMHSHRIDPYIETLANAESLHKYFEEHQEAPLEAVLLPYRQEIDRCFSAHTMEEIIERLSEQNRPWHLDTLKTLHQKSPTSLKVTLRQLQTAHQDDFRACLQREYGLAVHFAQHPDFYEGIRASVIDKDYLPHWSPNALEWVSDDLVNSYFQSDYAPILTFDL